MEIEIVPLFAGVVFGGLGLYIFYDYYRFNKSALKARGKILRYDEYESKDSKGRKTKYYRPTFQFSANESTYQVKSKTSFTSEIIPLGQVTEVLYQQGDEENARLSTGNGYGLGIIFLILSIPSLYIGMFK